MNGSVTGEDIDDDTLIASPRDMPVRGWTATPSRRDLDAYLRWLAGLMALWIVIYGGANWLAAQRSDLYTLHFAWERAIPFVPWMVWAYLSIFALLFLPLFALRAAELDLLGRRLAFAIVVSGAIFLLFPARLGFERPAIVAEYPLAFGAIFLLDAPHNLAPSLHISASILLLASLHAVSPRWLRRLIEAWIVVLCAAVLLVHQHHLLDVIGGLLVACAAFSRRLLARWRTPLARVGSVRSSGTSRRA